LRKCLEHYAGSSLVIPSCSSWFELDKIHEFEAQSLPEFFCGKFPHKTPDKYFNYRNFIIKLYREKPTTYLSATGKCHFLSYFYVLECRKKLPGDVCSIIRLHAFLEHWGLINFNVDSHHFLKPPKLHLGASVSPELANLASQGYLKLNEAE
jgi:SWI/SNF related-matrix-associated actin-dependent regulator of chromatin subfamily C